jgi:hypothetical protein
LDARNNETLHELSESVVKNPADSLIVASRC